ncbi:MAG: hypothetical protein AMXMBFR84_30110 [Candidatus Hydrogenedentota bacterium]
MKRITVVFLLAPLLMLVSGCVEFTLITWSPDGRYVYIANPDGEGLWVWDTQLRESKWILPAKTVAYAKQISDDRLFVFTGSNSLDEGGFATCGLEGQDWQNYGYETRGMGFTISADGRMGYIVEYDDEKSETMLFEQPLDDPATRRLLHKTSEPDTLLMPAVSPSGKQVLVCTLSEPEGKTLVSLDRIDLMADPPAVETLIPSNEGTVAMSPLWVDDTRFAYVEVGNDGGPDEVGKLMLYSMTGKSAAVLADRVFAFTGLSLHRDGKRIIATAAADNLDRDPDANWPSSIQIVSVDIETKAVDVITHDPMGAGWAIANPVNDSVAYVSQPGGDTNVVRTLDLATATGTTVWRNEEERIFAAAQRFESSGDITLAMKAYEELMFRFPDTDLNDSVWYSRMQMALAPPRNDLDEAIESLRHLDQSLRNQAMPIIWRESDRVATDPEGDWIRTYGTEAAKTKYEFDTDPTRDLTGLWARWSGDRLYLRIDSNSPNDLEGLILRDVIIALSDQEPGEGVSPLTPSTLWDRKLRARIVLRHWFDSESNSQYDVEVHDESGEIRTAFKASGFGGAEFPNVTYLDKHAMWNSGKGSIVLSLSQSALRLRDMNTLFVQVCTVKGGLDSLEPLERPIESADAKDCDIADAFGEENTAARIDADLAAGRTAIIRGYAAKLTRTDS